MVPHGNLGGANYDFAEQNHNLQGLGVRLTGVRIRAQGLAFARRGSASPHRESYNLYAVRGVHPCVSPCADLSEPLI